MNTEISNSRILVVDDAREILQFLKRLLKKYGFYVETASSGIEAINRVSKQEFDIVVTDLSMPGMDGVELLARLKELHPHLTIIMMTAYGTVKTAVQAIKEGAYDFIEKPFDPKEFLNLINGIIERQELWRKSTFPQIERRKKDRFENIIGYTLQMHKLFDEIKTVTESTASVLILGENGTGKELVTDAIHYRGKGKNKPIIKVNCGALVESIVESELFGHEKGAFTGAVARKQGMVELANGGTLFLDEIGELTLATQVKLLRVLETGDFQRVGGVETLKADFRLVSATNVDLEEAIIEKEFREDLYYRINTIILEIPPLRERRADIPLLAEYFLKRTCQKLKKDINGISNDVMGLFMKYNWPGNVRELSNTIERCATFCKGSRIVTANVPSRIMDKFKDKESPINEAAKDLSDVEASHIYSVLEEKQWNLKRAAEALNIARGTLYSKIKKYGITKPSKE